MFTKFLRFLLDLTQEKKPFICGGEHSIEIVEGNLFKGIIYYRNPTSEELLDYSHAALEYSQSELSDLAKKTVPDFKFQDLHMEMLKTKTIPFAKKIILRWENYYKETGEKVDNIQYLIDHYLTHIEYVIQTAFEQKTTFKKKF